MVRRKGIKDCFDVLLGVGCISIEYISMSTEYISIGRIRLFVTVSERLCYVREMRTPKY